MKRLLPIKPAQVDAEPEELEGGMKTHLEALGIRERTGEMNFENPVNDPNKHIAEYMDQYVKYEKPGFAVMISGPWGCGKSHFINNYISGKSPEDQKKYLQLSLNGISNVEGISTQILVQLCPGKIAKAMPWVGKLVSGVSKFFNVDGVVSSKDLLRGIERGLSDRVLVVDDLERCRMPISQTLGFLSGFIEQYGMKMILVGYEEEIEPISCLRAESEAKQEGEKTVSLSDDQVVYRRIREKVIGKRFTIEENSEHVVPCLIEQVGPDPDGVLSQNLEVLVSAVRDARENKRDEYNYRALSHVMRDFLFHAEKIDKEFSSHPDFMRDLLKVFCALGYELQLGNIEANEITQLDDSDFVHEMRQSRLNKKLTNIDEFMDRHSLSRERLIYPNGMWVKIFQNKKVLDQDIREALEHSVYFYQQKDQPDYVKLWHWRELEDSDAQVVIERVRNGLKERRYTIPGEVLHIFGSILYLSECRAIPEAEAEIVKIAVEYIDYLADNRKFHVLDNKLLTLDIDVNEGHGNLGYQSEKSKGFHDIKEYLMARARDTFFKNLLDAELPCLLDSLKKDPAVVCERLTRGDLFDVAILAHVGPYEFLSALMDIPNSMKREIAYMFKNRYRHLMSEPEHPFRREHHFLVELDKLIQHKLGGAAAGRITPSLEQLRIIQSGYLKEAIERTKPVKPSGTE